MSGRAVNWEPGPDAPDHVVRDDWDKVPGFASLVARALESLSQKDEKQTFELTTVVLGGVVHPAFISQNDHSRVLFVYFNDRWYVAHKIIQARCGVFWMYDVTPRVTTYAEERMRELVIAALGGTD